MPNLFGRLSRVFIFAVEHRSSIFFLPRYPMLRIPKLVLLFCVLSLSADKAFSANPDNRKITEIVFCIDMSGSTSGVFESFKKAYWKMISSVQGQMSTQHICVGLVGYSRESFKQDSNFVKVFVHPTENYEEVFLEFCKIKTYMPGGSQHLGALVDAAVNRVTWSKRKGAQRVLIVIGNGDVNIGPVKLKAAIRSAKRKGFVIQPVFLKSNIYKKEIKDWENFAAMSGESLYFVNMLDSTVIDNKKVDDLRVANSDFNQKIIYYGKTGRKTFDEINNSDLQTPADGLYERLTYKMFELKNENAHDWELVEYYNTSEFELINIARETLPVQYTTVVADSMIQILKLIATSKKTDYSNFQKEIEKIKPPPIDFAPADDKSMRFDAALQLIFRNAVNR